MQARLLLEDGSLFVGKSFGSSRESIGEVIFHTGMTAYQEVMTDPAYYGHIVTMTYPLIGNYGITGDDYVDIRPYVFGLIVRDYEQVPSNWRALYDIETVLRQYDIPGIHGIDTRMLTRLIRQKGAMKGILTTSEEPVERLMEKLKQQTSSIHPVSEVSTKTTWHLPGSNERIVVVDFGVHSSILRTLTERGCDVIVVPHHTSAEQIRKYDPDGVVLSNGPGNPKELPDALVMIRDLLGHIPIFGVSFGHQLLALSCGADVKPLKYGHYGSNHPVRNVETGSCYITSQQHRYAVVEQSIEGTPLTVTYVNNNDQTIEGLKHKYVPAFSIQYHPQASAEQVAVDPIVDQFIEMIRQHQRDYPATPRQAQFAASASQRKGEIIVAKE